MLRRPKTVSLELGYLARRRITRLILFSASVHPNVYDETNFSATLNEGIYPLYAVSPVCKDPGGEVRYSGLRVSYESRTTVGPWYILLFK